MRRSQRRSRADLQDIPLTPLIDTALTLLIIFMVATPMVQHAIKVELPRGSAQEEEVRQDMLVVHIDRDQHLFLNDEQMNEKQLIAALRTRAQEDEKVMVFIKADRAVSYGCVVELVDQLKGGSGIRHVALATKPTGRDPDDA